MNRLEERIRVGLHETAERIPDTAPIAVAKPVRSAGSRGPWVAVAAALAVLVVVGGVGLISGPEANSGPANGWIAVAEGGDIWLESLDQEPHRIIGSDNDGVDQLCPAFSPDGRRLAYGSWDGENAALEIVDVDAAGRVSNPATIDVGDRLPAPCPLWSPDGSHIAFGRQLNEDVTSAAGSEIRVVSLSDNSVTVLPDLVATDLEWAPDGSQLAIFSGVGAVYPDTGDFLEGRIFLFSVGSGTSRSFATVGAGSLTWSPDGGRIAYAAAPLGPGGGDLRVIDIDTEQQQVLATYNGGLYGRGPVWSPDGEWILDAGCGWRIDCFEASAVLVPAGGSEDGNEPSAIVIHSFIQTPEGTCPLNSHWVTWSSDGRYLLHTGHPDKRNPDICGSESFQWATPIDLETIRSVWMSSVEDLELNLAATRLPDPDLGDFDELSGWRSPDVQIQTWGIQPTD